ncbi:hypothetical protein T06_9206 [Trichinella sp. T6]|nr:hypothetical protein T06_9206 [Trichinella sp. T6]
MAAISLFLRQREQSRQTLITFSHKASTRQVRRASSLAADRVQTAEGGSILHIPGSKSQLKVGASGREDSRLRSRRSK